MTHILTMPRLIIRARAGGTRAELEVKQIATLPLIGRDYQYLDKFFMLARRYADPKGIASIKLDF